VLSSPEPGENWKDVHQSRAPWSGSAEANPLSGLVWLDRKVSLSCSAASFHFPRQTRLDTGGPCSARVQHCSGATDLDICNQEIGPSLLQIWTFVEIEINQVG